MDRSARKQVIVLLLLLAVTGSAAALLQGKGQKKSQPAADQKPAPKAEEQKPAPPKEEEPAPLFTGKMGLKTSRSSGTQQASGAFNGVGGDGRVDKSKLSSAVNSTDQQKAAQLAAYRVDPPEIDAFIRDGKLNAAAGQAAGK